MRLIDRGLYAPTRAIHVDISEVISIRSSSPGHISICQAKPPFGGPRGNRCVPDPAPMMTASAVSQSGHSAFPPVRTDWARAPCG